jgi:GIY-YIG catalytic domain
MDFNYKKDIMVNSWFWTGLIDGEGSFSIIISYLILFITENYYLFSINNYQDSVNLVPFLTIYSFIPFFILYTDKNSQDTDKNSQDSFNNFNKESKVSAVIVYSNVETDKSKILSENKGKAGIYQWIHIESGKTYIGSAVDLSKRLKDYFSKSHLERTKTRYILQIILHLLILLIQLEKLLNFLMFQEIL